jgi:adenine-specific DNA-methyltransferase
MSKKQKLELTWIGKDKRPKLEPRILLEDPARSYHAKRRVSDGDIFDNRLIFGDNLLALKALEQEYTGKVKCCFIDPPYNTGSAFTHYDDGLEHSIWLSLMRDRLEIIRRLLAEDGSLWITIDDNEAHYLKVLCDEIFGGSTLWRLGHLAKKGYTRNNSKFFSETMISSWSSRKIFQHSSSQGKSDARSKRIGIQESRQRSARTVACE